MSLRKTVFFAKIRTNLNNVDAVRAAIADGGGRVKKGTSINYMWNFVR